MCNKISENIWCRSRLGSNAGVLMSLRLHCRPPLSRELRAPETFSVSCLHTRTKKWIPESSVFVSEGGSGTVRALAWHTDNKRSGFVQCFTFVKTGPDRVGVNYLLSLRLCSSKGQWAGEDTAEGQQVKYNTPRRTTEVGGRGGATDSRPGNRKERTRETGNDLWLVCLRHKARDGGRRQ